MNEPDSEVVVGKGLDPNRAQPACGRTHIHKPHNGFATENPEPWCHGYQGPKSGSLDALLLAAYEAGANDQGEYDLQRKMGQPVPPPGRDTLLTMFQSWREGLSA